MSKGGLPSLTCFKGKWIIFVSNVSAPEKRTEEIKEDLYICLVELPDCLRGGPRGGLSHWEGGGPKDKTNWSGIAFSAIGPAAKIYKSGNLSSTHLSYVDRGVAIFHVF